jgi:selenocysteine-specific elongation factor
VELIKAVCADGRLVRISSDLVFTPGFVADAERVIRERGRAEGVTVSDFRQAIGTSRKFALPVLEYFDGIGLTRRQGDVRVLRS